ncbi:MAG: HNH endonuclease [Lactimicrobium massiliense]|nr:HNH endonuclease [Lactimicrobium massiliense]MDD6230406.1 HNH endonuclease [Lactimicrobium massiliense]MDD6560964.1 HNH endonuclease [Lactimicrobium massiliense]
MGQGKYKRNRPDKDGKFRAAFDKNKKIIYATQTVCAICGKPVDFSLKFPDPMSPTIDHIIPIAKGGHPSDLANMQLAHLACNRAKSDKVLNRKYIPNKEIGNRVLPQSMDWKAYRSA